ncbi:MAG: cupin domain-containing protein [Elusimicrobia bacterium]|nr:cupin domain-containing protein [Elusimicrobiota bacterium]
MIVKGHDNVKETSAEKSHGGKGPYSVRTLMETGIFDTKISYIRELVLPEGSSIGLHPHSGDEEIYYVVSGKGTMLVDNEKCPVKSGDAILTKSGSKHGLLNDSNGELKIFVICVKM